jgi:hypothetical protein
MIFPTIATFAFGSGNPDGLGALILHYTPTVFLTGAIWFIQAVHYPLFRHIAPVEFPRYFLGHQQFVRWVLFPGMFLEIATAVLLIYLWPSILDNKIFVASLVLLGILWISTLAFSLPTHQKLRRDGNGRRLVTFVIYTNWIRTICWTLRSIMLATLLLQQIKR